MPFDPVSITGYNANPPEDDGTQAASNEVEWQKHLDKIGTPLKTAFESLVTELTATFDELFDVLMAAAGTDLLFAQATAPVGWTKQTTHNNKALRLVTGATGGAAAGTTAFTSVFAARTIATANLPNINLSSSNLTGSVGTTITNGTGVARSLSLDFFNAGGGGNSVVEDVNSTSSTLSLASGTVSVGGTVPLGGSGTAMDFAVQYVDLIWCSKN